MQRLFTEPPFEVPGLAPLSIGEMIESIQAARDAGFTQVVVDTGFTTAVHSPEDWTAVPDQLAPLLEA
jgi:hypothetical protein